MEMRRRMNRHAGITLLALSLPLTPLAYIDNFPVRLHGAVLGRNACLADLCRRAGVEGRRAP